MPDDVEKKEVRYELTGDSTSLISTIQSTLKQLDSVEQKLKAAYQAAGTRKVIKKQEQDPVRNTTNLLKAQDSLSKLQSVLNSIDVDNVSSTGAEQITRVNEAVAVLDKQLGNVTKRYALASGQITSTNSALSTCNKMLKGVGQASKQTAPEVSNLSQEITKAARNTISWVYILKRVAEYLYQGYRDAQAFAETMNLFNVAVGDSRDQLLGLAEDMASTYHGDIKNYLNYIAVFRQFANTSGFAAEYADLLSTNLTKLGTDLASLYNTTDAQMYQALQSGLAGLTKPLQRYGISVHKATLEQELLRLGIDRSYASLNESEKVALRYITILRQTVNAQGDLARTLESAENQFKILTSQVTILGRNFGSFVVIIAQKVLPIINGFLIALNKAIEAMAKAAGYEIEDYSDNLSPTNEMLEEGTDAAEEYEDTLEGLLAPLDEINQASTGENEEYGTIDQAILDALEEYDNLMDKVYTKTDAFAELFSKFISSDLLQGAGTLLGSIFQIVVQALEVLISLLNSVSPILEPVLTFLGYILTGLSWLIDNIVSPILSFIGALTDNIWLLVAAFAALNLAQLAFTGQLSSMMAVKIAQWFLSWAGAIAKTTIALIANVAQILKTKIASAALAIAIWWETAAWWQKAIAVIAAAGALAAVVAGIVLAATASTKAAAESTMNSNSIPQMATGGVVSTPTVAMIGEGRYSEAVVPLGNSPQFKAMKDDIASQVARSLARIPQYQSSSAGGGQTPVILQIDGRTFARALLPYTGYTQPQTGVKLQ